MTSQQPLPQNDHPFDHLEDPYPWYDRLRQPPFYSQEWRGWVISRYEDIHWVMERPELFSAKDTMTPPQPLDDDLLAILAEGYPPVPAILNRDGDAHHQMRALVEQAFLPWLKAGKRSLLQQQANALVDAFAAEGHAELMQQFALPLSFGALCDLLGIAAEEQPLFRERTNATLELFAALNAPIMLPKERLAACARAFVQLQHFFGQLAEQRRQTQGDDLVSALGCPAPSGAPALPTEEVVAVLVDIVLGGYKTTASLIGNSVQFLLRAGAWQDLRAHPERIPLAVEEALRYDAPVQAMVRTATQAVCLPGASAPVEPETQVLLLFGAGNRDPAAFPRAETLDLQRKPNRHLSFGHGVHLCLGAPLARLEAQVALETLSRRLPHLQLLPGQPLSHVPTLLYRAYAQLHVSWQE